MSRLQILQSRKTIYRAGADVILVPAVGTVPGFDMEELKAVVREVHRCGGLVSAIGTSQKVRMKIRLRRLQS